MEQTTTILLIILGSVSGILILLLITIGFKVLKLRRTMQSVASILTNEADNIQKIISKVRNKVHKILE